MSTYIRDGSQHIYTLNKDVQSLKSIEKQRTTQTEAMGIGYI